MADDTATFSAQPELMLPQVSLDPETNSQMSPQTPSAAVDSALLELIQSVQHELRTPLHGMLALIDSLTTDMKKEVAETGNKQRVKDINALGGQLLSVLDDFRDYASHTIEAKTAEDRHNIEPNEEADLGNILDDIATEVWDLQVRTLQAEQGPDVRIPPPPELILTLDTTLQSKKLIVSVDSFKKVARKLIDNAMRFTTGEGFVEVSLAPHREEDAENEDVDRPTRDFLRLSVEDTGKGMTNEFVSEQLFTPFSKADAFKSGSGLSMALCSSLVRRMGGSMQVSSDENRGTTVMVLIPVTSLPVPSEGLTQKPSSADELAYFYRFEGVGLERLAGSISSQLATYGNVYTTTRPEEADYLLIPEEVCYGDNNDQLERLLDQAKDGIKIGVLQAHQDAKIELAAQKYGSPPPVYVTRKPFGPRSFQRLLQLATKDISNGQLGSRRLSGTDYQETGRSQFKRGRETSEEGKVPSNHSLDLIVTTATSDKVLRGTPPAARMISPLWQDGTAPLPRSFTALCVEDNALNMRILTRVLSQCKVPFYTAVDGQDAVEKYEKHRPTLVLLDITMPKKDGYQACKEMRLIKDHQSHIVAITALGDDYSRRKGIEECGMDEWLTKPLDIIKFKEKIKSLNEIYKSSGESQSN